MKRSSVILVGLFLVSVARAQISQPCADCLPVGIVFATQDKIDDFQANFPNCTVILGDMTISGSSISNLNGLNVLTSVGGNIIIYGNIALTSLMGLGNLTSVGGGLQVEYNDILTSLTGLDNLTSIGGDLRIGYNAALTSLAGLDSLTSIGGSLWFMNNSAMTGLTGLDHMTSIGNNLWIENNTVLSSLTGLDHVNSVGGSLYIAYNNVLTNLTGLENLTSVAFGLFIKYNNVLTSLAGLENLTSIGEGGLYIEYNNALSSLAGLENLASLHGVLGIGGNNSLSTCDAQWLCDYLSNPGGSIEIHDNANGCSSVIELADACGGVTCLPFGSYVFFSQSDIDHFKAAFPNCTELQNNVSIVGLDITNLNGLSDVTSIAGGLTIGETNALTSLTGLENLASIGGNLLIHNDSALTSLTGLDNLISIGGGLEIYFNVAMTNLTGLENVDPNTIFYLSIYQNPFLSTCEVKSICNYLAASNGIIYIDVNATGCNTQDQVIANCKFGYEDQALSADQINVYPNPTTHTIILSTPTKPKKNTFMIIYNMNGQALLSSPITEQQTMVDVSGLPQGVYFVRVMDDNGLMVGKFVKK